MSNYVSFCELKITKFASHRFTVPDLKLSETYKTQNSQFWKDNMVHIAYIISHLQWNQGWSSIIKFNKMRT